MIIKKLTTTITKMILITRTSLTPPNTLWVGRTNIHERHYFPSPILTLTFGINSNTNPNPNLTLTFTLLALTISLTITLNVTILTTTIHRGWKIAWSRSDYPSLGTEKASGKCELRVAEVRVGILRVEVRASTRLVRYF